MHPNAQLAAEAAEAAGAQGAFWEMHDLLLGHQDALTPRDLVPPRRASSASTSSASREDLRRRRARAARRATTSQSADASGVSGTPTFFINGRRHHGVYDIDTLTARCAGARHRATRSHLTQAGGCGRS